jgi:nitrite reductase/ring-hydroxylating ferredoxin subunit
MTPPSQNSPQPLVGYRTNEEWDDLLSQIAAVIEDLERLEEPDIRGRVFGALQAIDALHREALHRLVRLFKEGVLEQVATDPAIRTLLEMYDLLPAPHASSRKVWDFLTPEEKTEGRFKSSSLNRAGKADFNPIQPHWRPISERHSITGAEPVIFDLDEGCILVAKVENQLHAIEAVCPIHGAVMRGGVLRGFSWICPLGPGCVYDVRNGARLGGGPALGCYPVRTTGSGGLQIGFGIPFEPKLPAF